MSRVFRLLAFMAALFVPGQAPGETLVADLSDHLVAITAGFTGTDVVLFGAVDGPGDVIVVIRGPVGDVAVRRKERVAGLWVNRSQVLFSGVPSFYALASSRLLDETIAPTVLAPHQIGLDRLVFAAMPVGPEAEPFRKALIRNKQVMGHFAREVGRVTFLGGQLFRANLHFPANVPTGAYLVEVLLVRDGAVVSAQTTPLIISKVGIGADIFEFAHRESALYGAIAILGALLAGWIAHLAFRRR
jgi:uncharacterized protein (TIGR02186 family)